MSIDESATRNLNPNMAQTSNQGNRYANPFFDMSQQYMPPTIKELFRWCTFYYYNSPLIGSTITKISRYPITDLIIEDQYDSVKNLWSKIFNDELKIKERMLEINLDYHVYGNAFVSLSFPFTRFLICKKCKLRTPIEQANWSFNTSAFAFTKKCTCGHHGDSEVNDVPYKDRKKVRVVRWNPENMQIKFNEYTGKTTYMYSIPYKLKNAIMRGDKDMITEIPMIVIDAMRQRRMIRLNPENFRHIKRPTLAEQDQGWGKPLIIHVLKDMYYFYTLRRAQEAIALEHIVPFDIIYPMPNAQQDPYIHTDLGNWKTKIEDLIKKHRKDPNFKGVIPIPVGFGRLGGDGKAMMLTPELNYLTQTIVGGMGIPQEFLFGGLNWTGSSISLRTLENDFIQNRSQMLDVILWIKDKFRVYCQLPDVKRIRFSDFRMADDIQRNQQLIGLNAQMKVSDQTLLTELGYDYEQEVQKMVEEVYIANYLNEMRGKGQSKIQGESQVVAFNYQQKIQEMAEKAQAAAQKKLMGQPQSQQQPPQNDVTSALNDQGLPPQDGQSQDVMPQNGADVAGKINSWVVQLVQMDPKQALQTIAEIKSKMPDIGMQLDAAYQQALAQQNQAQPQAQPKAGAPGKASGGSQQSVAGASKINMKPMPEKAAPTRAGAV